MFELIYLLKPHSKLKHIYFSQEAADDHKNAYSLMATVEECESGRGRFQQGEGLRGRCEGLGICAAARTLHQGREAVSAIPATDGKGQHREDWLPVLRESLYTGHRSSVQQQPGLAVPKGKAKQDQV